MTKNKQISALILLQMSNGMTINEAMDAVLGAGTYERLVGEVYDELRNR